MFMATLKLLLPICYDIFIYMDEILLNPNLLHIYQNTTCIDDILFHNFIAWQSQVQDIDQTKN